MRPHWNLLLPAGFLVTLVAFFSYFMLFSQFPMTRNIPWVNLLLFALALGLLGVGLRRAFRQPERYRGKVLGPVLAVLSVLILGLFLFYNFSFSRQLPAAAGAPRVGEKAPDFTLPDQHGQPVKLSELWAPAATGAEAKPARWVLLVFYRGYW